jgi:hypothetical protein
VPSVFTRPSTIGSPVGGFMLGKSAAGSTLAEAGVLLAEAVSAGALDAGLVPAGFSVAAGFVPAASVELLDLLSLPQAAATKPSTSSVAHTRCDLDKRLDDPIMGPPRVVVTRPLAGARSFATTPAATNEAHHTRW